jgi:hypothetical protein
MAAYCNVNNLISMRYPYDWNLGETASNPNVIGFSPPNPNASAAVMVKTNPTSPSFISAPPADQLAGNLLQNEKRNLNNFQLLDSRPMYIGNHVLAYGIWFTHTTSNGQMEVLQIVTDGNYPGSYYFVILYGSPPSMFNTYLPTAMNMINTFGVALVC